MKIEDIIEALNNLIKEERLKKGIKDRTFLVLKKSVIPSSTFKAYKEFSYEVYLIRDTETYRVLMCNKMCRATTDAEIESIKRQCEIEFCTRLFEWKGSHFYDQVISGTYVEIL